MDVFGGPEIQSMRNWWTQPGQIQVIELLKCTGVLVENEDGNLVSPVRWRMPDCGKAFGNGGGSCRPPQSQSKLRGFETSSVKGFEAMEGFKKRIESAIQVSLAYSQSLHYFESITQWVRFHFTSIYLFTSNEMNLILKSKNLKGLWD